MTKKFAFKHLAELTFDEAAYFASIQDGWARAMAPFMPAAMGTAMGRPRPMSRHDRAQAQMVEILKKEQSAVDRAALAPADAMRAHVESLN